MIADIEDIPPARLPGRPRKFSDMPLSRVIRLAELTQRSEAMKLAFREWQYWRSASIEQNLAELNKFKLDVVRALITAKTTGEPSQ